MENSIQYGPYSPQEIERIATWLQTQKIQFEIIRDDQEAKEALMNDGQNVVNLADLRTGIYLAQVFYVNLSQMTDVQQRNFENLYCLKAEVFKSKSPLASNDDQQLADDSLKNQRKKRSWAIFLSVVLIIQIMIGFYLVILKGS